MTKKTLIYLRSLLTAILIAGGGSRQLGEALEEVEKELRGPAPAGPRPRPEIRPIDNGP